MIEKQNLESKDNLQDINITKVKPHQFCLHHFLFKFNPIEKKKHFSFTFLV